MAQIIDSPLYFPSHEYNAIIDIYAITDTPADGQQLTLLYHGQAIKQAKQTVNSKSKGVASDLHGVYIIRGRIDGITGDFIGKVIDEDGISHNIASVQVYDVMGKTYSTEVSI